MFLRPNWYIRVASVSDRSLKKERSASALIVTTQMYIYASLDNPDSLSSVLFHNVLISGQRHACHRVTPNNVYFAGNNV